MQIGCTDIKPYLVGESAYPLASWLQKPFPEATKDPEEIAFNKALSNARVAVECAFGMLKNHWCILGKRLDSKISFGNKIAVACAVLHNFCLSNQEDWNDDDDDNDNPQDQGHDNKDDDVIRDGDDVRSVLREYIANA